MMDPLVQTWPINARINRYDFDPIYRYLTRSDFRQVWFPVSS